MKVIISIMLLLGISVGLCSAVSAEDNLSARAIVEQDKENLNMEILIDTDKLILPETGENGSSITWETSDPDLIETPEGTVHRPASGEGNKTVTLTATIRYGEETETKVFEDRLVMEEYTAYLMTYFGGAEFINQNEGHEEYCKAHFAISYDGLTWVPLNGNKAVVSATIKGSGRFGTNWEPDRCLIRDPMVYREQDGSFRLLSTHGNSNPSIYVWDKGDLTSFTGERLLCIKKKSSGYSWAPEVIYDVKSGKNLIISSDPYAEGSTCFGTLTTDFTQEDIDANWDSDEVDFPLLSNSKLKYTPAIDWSIIRHNGKYYMAFSSHYDEQIVMARADSIGKDTFEQFCVITKEDASVDQKWFAEGPFVIKDLTRDRWYCYYDYTNQEGVFGCSYTDDLDSGEWITLDYDEYSMPYGVRHGNAIPLTQGELDKLINRWGLELESINTPEDINVQVGTKVEDLELPATVMAVRADGKECEFAVNWDNSGYKSERGRYVIKGIVEVDDTIYTEEEYTVTVVVNVGGVEVEIPEDIHVQVGTAFEDLGLPETVHGIKFNGEECEFAVNWDNSGYRSERGSYAIKGVVETEDAINPGDEYIITVIVKVGEAGKIARYRFDDSENGIVKDLSGNQKDALLVGDVTANNGEAVFNGGYIKLPDNLVDNLEGVTVSGWYNRSEVKYNSMLFTLGKGIEDYMLCCPQNAVGISFVSARVDNRETQAVYGEANDAKESPMPGVGIWTYVTASWGDGRVSFYVDGELVAQAEVEHSPTVLTGSVDNYLGKSTWDADPLFIGAMSCIDIYDRTLSIEEIRAQMQTTNVERLIYGLGEITLGSRDDVEAARKAYDSLTEAQKAEVNNLDILEDAESVILIEEEKEKLEGAKNMAQNAAEKALAAAEGTVLEAEKARKAATDADKLKATDKTYAIKASQEADIAEQKIEEAKKAAEEAKSVAAEALEFVSENNYESAIAKALIADEARKAAEDALTAAQSAAKKAEEYKGKQENLAKEEAAEKKKKSGGGGGGGGGAVEATKESEEEKAAKELASVKEKAVSNLNTLVTEFGEDVHTMVLKTLESYRILISEAENTEAVIAYEKEAESAIAEALKCPGEQFMDIENDGWYHESVDYMIKNGYMKGVSDTMFDISGTVSRAQLVTMLYRIEGEPVTDGIENPFSDVEDDAWYKDAVVWAASNGIVRGVNENEFAPEEEITREQMATIIYRYAESKGMTPDEEGELSFTDKDDVEPYAKNAVLWAKESGIIQGYPDGSFMPKGNITRAEAAAIFYRFTAGYSI